MRLTYAKRWKVGRSYTVRQAMQIFRRGDTIGYDEDAGLVVVTAALHAQRTKGLVVPESLLLVMMEDAEVARGFGAELERARGALENDRPRWVHERASNVAHWSQPARDALNGAAWRAMTSHRRHMTRGDVLAGIARAGGLAGPIATSLIPTWYDRPSSNVAPGVVVINDDATPMDFVVDTLKTHFGATEIGALYRMMRTHRRGSALVGAWEQGDAEARVAAAHEAARRAGFPLRFEISSAA